MQTLSEYIYLYKVTIINTLLNSSSLKVYLKLILMLLLRLEPVVRPHAALGPIAIVRPTLL